jgi:hypothetical protein
VGLQLKAGQRVLDSTSAGEFVVVRAPATGVDLTIGAQAPLLDRRADGAGASPPPGTGSSASTATVIGKRYASADGRLELLCIKPGGHVPVLNGSALDLVEPKPLPASD